MKDDMNNNDNYDLQEKYQLNQQIEIIKHRRFKSLNDLQYIDMNSQKEIVVMTALNNQELLNKNESHIFSSIISNVNNDLNKHLES